MQLPDNNSSSKDNIKPGWANDGLCGGDGSNTLPAVPFNFKAIAVAFFNMFESSSPYRSSLPHPGVGDDGPSL